MHAISQGARSLKLRIKRNAWIFMIKKFIDRGYLRLPKTESKRVKRKSFENACRHFFARFLDIEKLFLETVPFHLRDVCERCFYEHPVRMSKEAKALSI